jgi:hypothetical protein
MRSGPSGLRTHTRISLKFMHLVYAPRLCILLSSRILMPATPRKSEEAYAVVGGFAHEIQSAKSYGSHRVLQS